MLDSSRLRWKIILICVCLLTSYSYLRYSKDGEELFTIFFLHSLFANSNRSNARVVRTSETSMFGFQFFIFITLFVVQLIVGCALCAFPSLFSSYQNCPRETPFVRFVKHDYSLFASYNAWMVIGVTNQIHLFIPIWILIYYVRSGISFFFDGRVNI